MKKERILLFGKVILFISVTYLTFNAIYYFPDLPPTFRSIIKKGALKIGNDENVKVDRRFLKWFDRDPERRIPADPNIIVSPADGIVQHIDSLDGRQHVVIEMRYTDVHVQRIPISGAIISIEGDGKKLPAGASVRKYFSDKMLPYQKRTVLETEIGQIAIRQITSLFASRIEVFVNVGEKVKKGQKLGRVIAGSTVVLEIPMNIRVLVKKNEEVTAGETILARY